MPDFLTRRNGTWHFVRRVPSEFASFDSRGIVKHSTRIKIANDRAGRRAARVAEQLNRQLEIYWKGFARYRDKSSSLSAAVNKYLWENKLRPTKDHTVYSLRHSFKDRLIAAEAPDSLIDSLMGHKSYKPKYGKGPPLELKLKYLQRIALKPLASV